jgi:polyisoprenoid-binding protein YceI
MRALLLLLGVLAATASVTSASAAETRASSAGEIRFTARYEGQALEGVFRNFRVEMPVGSAAGEPLALRVSVMTGSADMNDVDVNAELKTPTFFDVASHPEAVFSSDTIEQMPDGGYTASGTITVKGVAHPLTVPFRLRATGAGRELSGEVSVSRLAWRIGLGEWAQTDLIADDVEVRFRIELPGATP